MTATLRTGLRISVIACASAWATGAAAQDASVEELAQPESSVSAGIGGWSSDRRKLGIYDGMRQDKAYGLLDFDYVKRDDATGTWTTFSGSNLGLDTREFRAEWLRQGDVGASLEYSRTPRDNPIVFSTGLQGIGTTFQTISGAGGSALPLRDVELGTTRDATSFGLYKRLQRNLELKVNFRNEEKNGERHWGLGSAAYFLTEPIDSTTRLLDVTLDYGGDRLQLSGGYSGSWYDNANSLVWGLVNGAAQPGTTQSPNPTPLTLPLDNQAHQFYLNGGYSFTPTTRGSFKVSYGRATQDEQLPTWDLAAPNDRFASAPSHLDGRIDTTLVEGTVTAQPMPRLSVVGSLRYHDAKDKTPLAQFVGPPAPAPTVFNTPHSIKTKSGRLEATYRLPQNWSVAGGVEYREQERSVPSAGTLFVPFRPEIDETTWRLRLRRAMSDRLSGYLAYAHSDRGGSAYALTNDAMEDAIAPVHIADRKRDKWRAALDWAPHRQLNFQFAFEDARDDYASGAQPQGLKDGKAQLFSVDGTYTYSDKWQVNAWYSRDENEAHILGFRETGSGAADAQKDARLRETGDTIGIGVRGTATSRLSVGGNLEWQRTVSRHQQDIALLGAGAVFPTSGGVTLVPLPDIHNRITRLKLFGQYALNKNSELRVDFVHERWRGDEWTWRFAGGDPFTYGTTVDGTVTNPPLRATANFIGARYIYRFR